MDDKHFDLAQPIKFEGKNIVLFLPHMLLWGMTSAHLSADAPAWAHQLLDEGWPVVVRRAVHQDGLIPIGIRGHTRSERWAGWLPANAVTRTAAPEALSNLTPQRDLPTWQALAQLRPTLDATGLIWGITGATGFELATGIPVLRTSSDLDLLLRTPQPFSREQARALWAECQITPCRIDLQLQTPSGGLALAEWAGDAAQVMVKDDHAPRLLTNPWAAP